MQLGRTFDSTPSTASEMPTTFNPTTQDGNRGFPSLLKKKRTIGFLE